MSETELIIIAKKLANILHLNINNSPADPTLPINALKCIIPQAKQYLQEIQKLQTQQDQWNAIINFIQSQILDENEQFGFQKLDTEELIQIYQVIYELACSMQQNNQEEEETSSGPDDSPIRQSKSQAEAYIQSLREQMKIQKEIKSSQNPNDIRHSQKKQSEDPTLLKSVSNKKQKQKNNKPKNKQLKPHKNKQQQKKVLELNHHNRSANQRLSPDKKVVKKGKNTHTERPRPVTAHNKVKLKKQQIPFQQQIIKTVSEVIKGRNTRKKLNQNAKTSTLLRDPQALQAMQRAKSKFQNQLKQHERQLKSKKESKNKIKKELINKKNEDYLEFIKKKQKSMEQNVVNEQLKYYMKLRQKKINYIKHMHKLMETLEKERQINLHKEQAMLQKKQKQLIKKKIDQADHLFQQNMDQLKSQFNKKRTNQSLKNEQQLKICRQMQKGLNNKKMQEIQLMKILWQQQRMKLGVIIEDQQKIKNKIIDMYRKNRP